MSYRALMVCCVAGLSALAPAMAASAQDQAQAREVEEKIFDVSAPNIDRTMKIVEFDALSIGRTTKYMVLLPEGYETTDKRYPVLYLLHGLLQNYTVWPMMGAAYYSRNYDLIVVMPDVGNSWYINWARSEGDEQNNWEDFILYDLIHSVDQTFRTVPSREGRSITGLSMGGYGAIMLGLRNPRMFSSVGSHSGALGYARNARLQLETGASPEPKSVPAPLADDPDADVPEVIKIPGFTMQHERYPKGVAFLAVEECNEHDPFELIQRVPISVLPHIYLDCGLDDSLLGVTQEFAALLLSKNIPFTYGQTPGEHRPSYWSRELAQSMAVQVAIMERTVRMWEQRQAQAAEAAQAAAEVVEAQEDTEDAARAKP